MYDDVTVIQEHPMAVIQPLGSQELDPFPRAFLLDEFGDGLYLRSTFPGADDKIIGDDGETGEIKNNEIDSLLLEGRFCCLDG